jgi:glycosyltransferase involved in cell wall biosynthesis
MASSAERTKVVHIVTRMNTGGVAVLIANLMTGLDPKKFELTLITGSCDSTEEDYLEKIATSIPYIKVESLQRAISPRQDLLTFINLWKILRAIDPAVIHTHTSKAGLIGRIVSRVAIPRAKRIHTFHGHLLDGYFSPLKTRLITNLERSLAKKTDVLVAMGNQVKKDLQAAGVGSDSKFRVFFPGLKDANAHSKESSRIKLDVSSSQVVCLFVGRLTQIKRPDRLLDAIRILKEKNLQVQFLIAGDGELSSYVEDQTREEGLPVKMLGWVKDTSEAFSAADILVLCSDNEAVSLVLIEGSQYGLPLVSTNVGSVSDVVIDHSTGYLTESTPQSLADAIEKLVRDPKLRQMMGEAGKARAAQYFSLDRMLKDHSDLYRSL